jgi:hypothetical protein
MSITRSDKSNLFRRAHQIVRVNSTFSFSDALKLAWSELKEGATWHWLFDSVAETRATITALENTTRLGPQGLRRLVAAYADLARLQSTTIAA